VKAKLVALALLVLAAPALAGGGRERHEKKTIFVFGDSYSDNGNGAVDYPGGFDVILRPPTAVPRFSNGPIWVDYLGEILGEQITPVVDGGTNYAIGGATISPANPYTFDAAATGYAMVDHFLGTYGTADPKAIYIVWLGTNDLDGPADFTQWNYSNLVVMIQRLYDAGARQFLIPDVVDEGSWPLMVQLWGTPEYDQELNQMALLWSQLLEQLPATFPNANIRISHVRHLFEKISKYPKMFGFTDTTDACFRDWTDSAVCSNPYQYLYWDYSHPSTHTHRMIADLFVWDLLSAGQLKISDLRMWNGVGTDPH